MYKCIQSFKISDSERYLYGDKITEEQYKKIKPEFKNNFTYDNSEDLSGFGTSTPIPGIGDLLGTGLPGGLDFDFTTPL